MKVGVKYGMRVTAIKSLGRAAFLLCALIAVSLVVVSCGTSAGNRKDAKIEQHRRFLTKPYEYQRRDFLIFPIERQFDVYLMETIMFEPPDLGFADDIVKTRRGDAVPFLIEQLGRENFPDYGKEQGMTDDIKDKTIYLFKLLQMGGYYDVASDKAAIAAIRNAIAAMETPASRRRSQGYLDEILGAR